MKKRSDTAQDVWVTGVGLHSAFGDLGETWNALAEGRSALKVQGLSSIDDFPPVPVAASGKTSVRSYLTDRKLAKYMSPTTEFAVVAAGQALRQAGLFDDEERKAATALYVATNLIAFDVSAVTQAIESAKGEDGTLDMARMGGEGWRRCHPLMPFKMLLNMPLGLISIVYGLQGANAILYPTPDQAALCMDMALRGIRAGRFSRALVGATAHNVDLLPLSTYRRLGRLAANAEAAQPYGSQHSGYALGDGAGFLMLESEASVIERGVEPLARIRSAKVSRSWQPGVVGATEKLWRGAKDLGSANGPDLLVSTGSLNTEDDVRERTLANELWPAADAALMSLDGRLGYWGAAALMGGAGLAVTMLHRQERIRSTTTGGDGAPKEIWSSLTDPDGAGALLRFEAAKGGGA